MADTTTATMGGFGIAAYMAPELVWGQDLTLKSVIYSLGILLYEMITGVGHRRTRPDQWPNQRKGTLGADTPGTTLASASSYGAFDMAWNVWKRVADWFDEDYYRNAP